MIQILPFLWLGNDEDVLNWKRGAILHCARDPWHKNLHALMLRHKDLGHTIGIMSQPIVGEGKVLFPEGFLFAGTDEEFALNLVDATDPKYFRDDVIDAGLQFISIKQQFEEQLLVHCNGGFSRSPSLVFLWMYENGKLQSKDFYDALTEFQKIYPPFNPGRGAFLYLKNRIGSTKRLQ